MAGSVAFVNATEFDSGASALASAVAPNPQSITSPAISVTAGNLLLVAVAVTSTKSTSPGANAAVKSITDSIGTSFVLAKISGQTVQSSPATGSSNMLVQGWIGYAMQTNTKNKITVNFNQLPPGQASACVIFVAQYSGVLQFGDLSIKASTSATTLTTLIARTHDDNNFLAGVFFSQVPSGTSITANTGTSRSTGATNYNSSFDVSGIFLDNKIATAMATSGSTTGQLKATFGTASAIVGFEIELRGQVIGEQTLFRKPTAFDSAQTANKASGPMNGHAATLTVGDDVFVAVAISSAGGPTVSSITDSLGNVYSLVQAKSSGTLRLEVWHTKVTVGGSIGTGTAAITATLTASATVFNGTVAVYIGLGGIGTPITATKTSTTTLSASGTTQGGYDGFILGFFAFDTNSTITASASSGVLRVTVKSVGAVAQAVIDNFATNPLSSLTNGATASLSSNNAVAILVPIMPNSVAAGLVDPRTSYVRRVYLPQGPIGAPIRS